MIPVQPKEFVMKDYFKSQKGIDYMQEDDQTGADANNKSFESSDENRTGQSDAFKTKLLNKLKQQAKRSA